MRSAFCSVLLWIGTSWFYPYHLGLLHWHWSNHTVYPKKYAHGFVVLCFVVVTQSFIINSHEVFIHIHRGCFAGTGAIVRLPQCQWSKPDGYGKISQCITTTKHSKTKTVCIFLGIYCKPDGYGKISQCMTTTKHSKAKSVCIFLGIYCICASKLTIIGSDNLLSLVRRQAIIWTNDGVFLIRTIRTKFSELLGEIHTFFIQKYCIGKHRLRNGGNLFRPHCVNGVSACEVTLRSMDTYTTWINCELIITTKQSATKPYANLIYSDVIIMWHVISILKSFFQVLELSLYYLYNRNLWTTETDETISLYWKIACILRKNMSTYYCKRNLTRNMFIDVGLP